MVRDTPPPAKRPGARALLAWYDRSARALPWRAGRGQTADPYAVWLSEIMLQQTNVTTVKPYYEKFLALWPRVEDLAAAPVEAVMRAWAGLGYYSRARNLHACAILVARDHGGAFPGGEEALRALPGIGAYTAAAITAIAFGRRAVVVDGNVERVAARLFAIGTPMPKAKALVRAAMEEITPRQRAGDFAQGMMDLGATLCSPRSPACGKCPFADTCAARLRGEQERFPVKAPKKARPHRKGALFYLERADGAVLVRTRAPRGLLGGMTEFPGTAWDAELDAETAPAQAPLKAPWRRLPGRVEHVFTHFSLELAVFAARVPRGTPAPGDCRWTPQNALAGEALPSLMRKAAQHAADFARAAPQRKT